MGKFSSPFMAKSPLHQEKSKFGGTPDKTPKQAARQKATDQLYNEGSITETNDEAMVLIDKRVKENSPSREDRQKATDQLYNEGLITETNDEAMVLIGKRVKENSNENNE